MDASHFIAPEGSGSFLTKSVATRAIGIPDGKTADAVLAELGVRTIRVGGVEFVYESDLQAALAEKRRLQLKIPSEAESIEKAARMPRQLTPEQQVVADGQAAIQAQLRELAQQIAGLTRGATSADGAATSEVPIASPKRSRK